MNPFPAAVNKESKWWSFLTVSGLQASVLKSIATHTVLAVSVAASAALAFRNPKQWLVGSLSISIVNLYALPKVLRYGNQVMIKTALVLNFIATGSLTLGGVITGCYFLSSSAVMGLSSFDVAKALLHSFIITGLIGYIVPRALEALNRTHEILNKDEWNERLENLCKKFNQLPEMGLGLLQCNLWHNLLMHLTLVMPKLVLDFCDIFEINPSDDIWALAMLSSNRIKLSEFKQELNAMMDVNPYHRLELGLTDDEEMPEDKQIETYQQINILLRSINDDDFQQAIEYLISDASRLAPALLSKQRYLELFQEFTLDATNAVCQQFLDQMADWKTLIKDYWSLGLKIVFLDFAVKQMQPEQKEEFSQQCKDLNKDFLAIRSTFEKIYSSKRMWQPFTNLDDKQLPFKQAAPLLALLKDNQLMENIDKIYHSLYGTGVVTENTNNLADILQLISNKVSQKDAEDEDEPEDESLIEILGANHAFVVQDYNDLQVWLNLESPHEIEDKLATIGLKTEKDLFDKEILISTEETGLSTEQTCKNKEQLRKNLEAYIKNAVGQKEAPAEAPAFVPYNIWKKTARVVYNLINGGLILVPALIQPIAGAAGFVSGTCFFVLKRFNFHGTEFIAKNVNDFFNFIPLGRFIRNLMSRPIFSLNESARKRRELFVSGNFYTRIRLINLEMLLTLFLGSFCGPKCDGVGSFAQGVAISRQVVELF